MFVSNVLTLVIALCLRVQVISATAVASRSERALASAPQGGTALVVRRPACALPLVRQGAPAMKQALRPALAYAL